MRGTWAGRQAGIAILPIVTVIAVLAAAGAGFVAWQKMSELDRLQGEFANVKLGFDKVRVDLRKAAQDSAVATKELTELRIAVDQLRAERDAVRTSLETEQSAGVRLRADLALAKEQVSYLSARAQPGAVKGMPRAPTTAPTPAAKK